MYDGLAAAIKSASVGTLAADASDIITLVENQYRVRRTLRVPACMHTCMDINCSKEFLFYNDVATAAIIM